MGRGFARFDLGRCSMATSSPTWSAGGRGRRVAFGLFRVSVAATMESLGLGRLSMGSGGAVALGRTGTSYRMDKSYDRSGRRKRPRLGMASPREQCFLVI